MFPAPTAIQAQYKPADGYEWSVLGIWDAENRPRGASLSFYINKIKSNDSALVKIYNSESELIRTMKWAVDSGFNKKYWGMEERGYRQPNSPKPQPNSPEPGGAQVLPGNYKVVMTYADQSDSTSITVNDDPRLGNRNDVKLAQRKAADQLRKAGEKLSQALDRITEAEEVCNKIINQLKGLDGKAIDSLRKTSNGLIEDIKKFRESINGKTSDKQGIVRSPFEVTVMSQWQTAQQAIGAKMVAPGPQEQQLITNAENAIKSTLNTINSFFETKWTTYRKQVEETKLNLFKEYKPIE